MNKTFLTFLTILIFQLNAFSQEANLENFHNCRGTVIETKKGEISGALSYYSPSRSECRNGLAILTIEKFKKRIKNKAQFDISDSLRIQSKCPNNCLYITRCTDNSGVTKQYILLIDSQVLSNEFFNIIKKSWTYNNNFKFIDTSSKELSCVNNDYGA